MENETQKFKEAIRALLRVKNTACGTSQYKYDLLNENDKLFYAENRIKKIEDSITEYNKSAKEWESVNQDAIFDTVPMPVYDLIRYLKFEIASKFAHAENMNSETIEKEIQEYKRKINSEIKEQIVNMTYEFIDEDDLIL